MPQPITPATRLQILTLRGENLSYSQIAEKLGVHHDTVMRAVRRANGPSLRSTEQALAKREDILRRMAYIMQHADKHTDSIAAGKLIAMMEGWLAPTGESVVNVNVLGQADISVLEREYAALKSPTTQSLVKVDTSPSPDAQTPLLSQPSASEPQRDAAEMVEGGGTPPVRDGNGI